MYKLKELRKLKKISQQQLADELNISRESVSKYEKGEQDPSYSTLKKIAKYFNVTIDYLLSTSEDNLIMITKEDYSNLKKAAELINNVTKKIINQEINISDNHGTIKINQENKE